MLLPNGEIAVNDDYRDRVVIDRPAHERGSSGSTGTQACRAERAGFLNTPDGMDFVPLGPNDTALWSLVHHP